MKPHKPENGMQVAELRFLRAKVAELEKKASNAPTSAPIESKVEHKIDVKAIGTLRITLVKLLTAIENFTGPETTNGVTTVTHKPNTELRQAMDAAAKIVRPQKAA